MSALSRHKGRRQLVIVEGIYSMDGDFGNLDELINIAESHGASVFVDEAHSMLGLRRKRSRRGGKVRCGRSHSAGLRYIFQSLRRAGWIRGRLEGDAASICAFTRIPTFTRARCRRSWSRRF